MSRRLTLFALLVAFVATDAMAQNRTHRRRGALLGGLAGAALGAAIGDRGDNETAGALIGGAVGAFAGGTIGDQKDRRIEHNRMYHSGHGFRGSYPPPGYVQSHTVYPAYRQPYHGETVAPPQALPISPPIDAPISPADVVAMTQSGLSDAMIIQQIQIKGVTGRLSVSDVIQLHQLGVREGVISAMQGVLPSAVGAPPEPPIYDAESNYRIPPTNDAGFGTGYGPSILNSPR